MFFFLVILQTVSADAAVCNKGFQLLVNIRKCLGFGQGGADACFKLRGFFLALLSSQVCKSLL